MGQDVFIYFEHKTLALQVHRSTTDYELNLNHFDEFCEYMQNDGEHEIKLDVVRHLWDRIGLIDRTEILYALLLSLYGKNGKLILESELEVLQEEHEDITVLDIVYE